MGVQHIQLFMDCLSEWPLRIRPSHWDGYRRRLADWLRLETRIARRRGIGSSMAFPEDILREQLHSIPPCSTKTIMRTISDRNSLSKSFIEYIDQLKAESSDKSLFCWIMPSQYALKFSDNFNFTTMRIFAQRSKLPESTASLFMEQIRSQSNPEIYAYRTLMLQHHLPDKAIEDLVEWLEDPRLSGYAVQLLGNQTALSKETIDYTTEKLTGPLGYWDIHQYRSSVCLGQDLHAEAIGKVMDFLENAALRATVIHDPISLDLSRMHLLQPDVERLGSFVKRRPCSIYKESKDLAVKALGQQANLSTNVPQVFVKLLRDEHSECFGTAQQILQKQPALHDDIVDKL